MKKINRLLSILFIGGMLLEPMGVKALTKKESVYTNLDVNGNVRKTTVTNHLLVRKNTDIQDETELKEILNINGMETFQKKDNQLLWENKGNDIFYRGSTKKENPITVAIDYFLDEKKMDAKEMIGKKGKVKIILSFTNNLENKVVVNGKEETLYTPFFVTAGMILDNKNNSNITIGSGKVIDNGTRSILLALATPGLYESVGLNDLKPLNKIIIEYQTTKFSLGNIYLVATPKLIEDVDFDVFNKLNQVSSSVNLLGQNMNTIEKGSKDLLTGSKQVNEGAELISSNLQKAMIAVEQLDTGANQLQNGITTVKNQVLATLGSTKNTSSLEQLKQLQAQNTNTITSLLTTVGMDYQTLEATVNAGGSGAIYDNLKNTYGIVTLLLGNNQAIDTILTQLGQSNVGMNHLIAGLEQLEIGATKLSTGISEFQIGMEKLNTGTNTLVGGTKQLQNGAMTLSQGISKFNQEGIRVLNQAMGKVNQYTSKIDALMDLSKNYNGFTSKNATNTIFIYQVQSLK